MNKPLISIIVPTFNSSKFIKETIQSIIDQTYGNWELLITDDCSSDDTVSILKHFAKNEYRIKVFELKKRSGAAIARNNSMKNSKGDFWAFCDSDDLWSKNKLEMQLKFMLNNNYSFTFTHYTQIDENGNKIKSIDKIPTKVNYLDTINMNYMGCLTVMINIKILGKKYMENLKKRQDYSLWLNYLKKTKYAYCLNHNLGFYRKRRNSISKNKISLIYYHFIIYWKFEKFNLLKSIYFSLIYSLNTLKK